MISNWLSTALARRNIHYGWVMVGVTFLTALITAGTVGAPGDFIAAVDPLHPVRADGAVRGRLAEPLRPAQRGAVSLADRGLGAGDVAGDDKALAVDAVVGRRGRHWHRHDGAGAGRHGRRALVFRPARAGGRDSHRQRGHRAIGVPAAAGEAHRTNGLARGAGPDVPDARRRGVGGAAGDARSSERSGLAAIRR